MDKPILSPLAQQYQAIRATQPPDVILFFRLGDFYEMFFQDAIDGSALLEVTLTKRNEIPMCGVPVHSAERYIRTLISKGRKVAVCDVVEAPKPGKPARRVATHVIAQ